MKSHLISDPNPIERHLDATDAARMYLLDQLFTESMQHGMARAGNQDDSHRAPETPMRNFLQVVFIR